MKTFPNIVFGEMTVVSFPMKNVFAVVTVAFLPEVQFQIDSYSNIF